MKTMTNGTECCWETQEDPQGHINSDDILVLIIHWGNNILVPEPDYSYIWSFVETAFFILCESTSGESFPWCK